MKKLSLVASAVLFAFLVSSCCCNSEKKEGGAAKCCEKDKKEMTEEEKVCAEFKAKWEDFENLAEDVQKELIAKKKGFIEARREALKAEIAECEKKFEGFEALTVAEQKEFLDNLSCCATKKCCKDKKEGCCKK